MVALAEEISLMLDEGVVAAAADIDLCLILGAGWPFHLGGITPYLDRTGISERVTGRRFTVRVTDSRVLQVSAGRRAGRTRRARPRPETGRRSGAAAVRVYWSP